MDDGLLGLFAYGTLQVASVFRAVTGIELTPEPATLPGYRCRRLAGRTFPGIVPDPKHETSGTFYRGIDDDVLERLDAFEDDFYERRAVDVAVGGDSARAWVYVVALGHRDLLSDEPWDLERFVRDDLDTFLRIHPPD